MNQIIVECPICGEKKPLQSMVSKNNVSCENTKEYMQDTDTKYMCKPCEQRIDKAMRILKE